MMLAPVIPTLLRHWRGKIAPHVPTLFPLGERVVRGSAFTGRRGPGLYLPRGYGHSGRTARSEGVGSE